ncbi:hypothetical protein SRHO_G00006440, partial [Serrasalmus rhombeus]
MTGLFFFFLHFFYQKSEKTKYCDTLLNIMMLFYCHIAHPKSSNNYFKEYIIVGTYMSIVCGSYNTTAHVLKELNDSYYTCKSKSVVQIFYIQFIQKKRFILAIMFS